MCPNASEQRRIDFIMRPDELSELGAESALDLFALLGAQFFADAISAGIHPDSLVHDQLKTLPDGV